MRPWIATVVDSRCHKLQGASIPGRSYWIPIGRGQTCKSNGSDGRLHWAKVNFLHNTGLFILTALEDIGGGHRFGYWENFPATMVTFLISTNSTLHFRWGFNTKTKVGAKPTGGDIWYFDISIITGYKRRTRCTPRLIASLHTWRWGHWT